MEVTEAIKFSPFPPVTAFVMLPLTFFEVQTASRIWILFNVLLFLPAVIIIRRITSWGLPHSILFILASGLSLINNIRFGQVYWLMTVALLYSFYWTEKKREGLSGLILGIFTSIKYFSIIFIASQFFAKHYKTVVISFLTIGLLFFLQFYFFGLTVMKEYFTIALVPHLNGHLSSQTSSAFEFQSWESFLLNAFDHSSANLIAKDIVKWIVYLLFISPLIYIFVKYKEKLIGAEINRSIYFALPALAALVLLPASATYHFILLLIPIGLLLSSAILTERGSRIISFLFLCIGFIPYHSFFELGATWFLPLAYPRLFLMSLLYLVAVKEVIFHLRINRTPSR